MVKTSTRFLLSLLLVFSLLPVQRAYSGGISMARGWKRVGTQTLTAGGRVDCSGGDPFVGTIVPVAGSGGPVDLTSDPQVIAGTVNGQHCLVLGQSDANTLKLDTGTGLGLRLSRTLKLNQGIELVWDSTAALWRDDGSLLTVEDSLGLINGPNTWMGTQDFGGATLIIPNSNGLTPTASARIGFDPLTLTYKAGFAGSSKTFATTDLAELLANKGAASGYAGLDASMKILAANLPNPSASTFGGIESYAAVANQWINAISTSGVPSSAQPSASNLSNGVSGSGAVVLVTGATLIAPVLGTPVSGIATNLTGTAAGLTAGNVTTNANLTGGVTSVGNAATVVTNANLTGPITSIGNATAVAAQTGTGTTFVMNTGPTITNPIITNIAPGADFTLTQNSVVPFTSVNAGAVANTLYLKEGNVGIGTTTPGAKLAVLGTVSNSTIGNSVHIRAGSNSGAGGDLSEIGLGYSGSAVPPVVIAAVCSTCSGFTAQDLIFATRSTTGSSDAPTEKVRITTNGNVGIGTITPATLFHTTGGHITIGPLNNSTAADFRLREGSTNGTEYEGFKAPDAITTSLIWTLPLGDGTAGQVWKTDGAGNLGWAANAASGMSNPMTLSGDLIYASVSGAPATAARLGIGMVGQVLTVSAGLLPVWGAAGSVSAAGSNTQVQVNVGGAFGASANFTWDNTNFTLSSLGNITGAKVSAALRNSSTGSGSSNELDVGNDASASALLLKINSAAFTNAINYAYLYNTQNAPLLFGTNNIERMRIDAAGNVLVGTTTSLGKLTVVDTTDTWFLGSYSAARALNNGVRFRAYDSTSQVIGEIRFQSQNGTNNLANATIAVGNGAGNATDSIIITGAGLVNVGGNSTPTSLFSVGSTSQFQVNSTGAIAAATGITSSGTITFSAFSSNGGPLYTNGSGVLAQVTAGTTVQVLHGGTTPSFSAVALGTDVSGTLLAAQFPALTGPITTAPGSLATVVASQTGTGSIFVMQTGPVLTAPNIGAATGTSLALGGSLNAVTVLDLTSITKGFRTPQMTTPQRDAITAVEGLEIYNLTTHRKNYYNGTTWIGL